MDGASVDMAFTRGRHYVRAIYWAMLSRYYATRFRDVGPGFLVKGRCEIRNAGELETGEACILDSSWADPITINVGVEARLRIGSDVYINHGTSIVCRIEITIGDRCLIGPGVLIMDEDGHPMNWRTRRDYSPKGRQGRIGAPVVLERGVWVGARAILLKGVTIGEHSVIGAGAVVSRPIPAKVFAAGVPARVIHDLPE